MDGALVSVVVRSHTGLEHLKEGLDDQSFAQQHLVQQGHQIVLPVAINAGDPVKPPLPEALQQWLVQIECHHLTLLGWMSRWSLKPKNQTARDNRLFLQAVLSLEGGAPVPPGEICLPASAIERASSAASAAGQPMVRRRDRRRHCPGSPESRRGRRGTRHPCMGRSRGGLPAKIVALVDDPGNLGVLPPAARTEPREQRGSATDRQSALWCAAG